jgi:hypothetical protein
MELQPKRRYVFPGDDEKQITLPFSVAELKTLQGIILDRIEQDAKEKNAAFKPHFELATKLEYYLSDLE